MNTWIIVANASSCRVLSYEKNPPELSIIKDTLNATDQLLKKFSVIKEFIHPEGRLRDVDLTSGKSGQYKGGPHSQNNVYNPKERAKEITVDHFVKDIIQIIEDGMNSKQFSQLVIVAPEKMVGLIRKNIHSNINSCIIQEIHKDYNKLSLRELVPALQQELHPTLS